MMHKQLNPDVTQTVKRFLFKVSLPVLFLVRCLRNESFVLFLHVRRLHTLYELNFLINSKTWVKCFGFLLLSSLHTELM